MIDDIARVSTIGREPAQSAAHYWTRARLANARRTLEHRVADLRADIVRELRKYDDERLTALADNVADSAELSIADLIGDVYLAEIERDLRDLHEVERAVARIRSGKYGACTDCGKTIDPQRLRFHPQAARCVHCQDDVERALRDGQRSTRL